MKFKEGQHLLFENRVVSFHSSQGAYSLIRIQNIKPAEMIRFKRRSDYYVDIASSVYLKVISNTLVPFNLTSNREAVYLLEEE